jgi:hypothetical protein
MVPPEGLNSLDHTMEGQDWRMGARDYMQVKSETVIS